MDHINRNTLDNRPENLRAADKSSNQCNAKISARNTSGVKGVSWDANSGKWLVSVCKNRKRYYGGLHSKLADAETVADQIRNNAHGEFARKV